MNWRDALINALWRLVSDPMGDPEIRRSVIQAWLLARLQDRVTSLAEALCSLASVLGGSLNEEGRRV